MPTVALLWRTERSGNMSKLSIINQSSKLIPNSTVTLTVCNYISPIPKWQPLHHNASLVPSAVHDIMPNEPYFVTLDPVFVSVHEFGNYVYYFFTELSEEAVKKESWVSQLNWQLTFNYS